MHKRVLYIRGELRWATNQFATFTRHRSRTFLNLSLSPPPACRLHRYHIWIRPSGFTSCAVQSRVVRASRRSSESRVRRRARQPFTHFSTPFLWCVKRNARDDIFATHAARLRPYYVTSIVRLLQKKGFDGWFRLVGKSFYCFFFYQILAPFGFRSVLTDASIFFFQLALTRGSFFLYVFRVLLSLKPDLVFSFYQVQRHYRL